MTVNNTLICYICWTDLSSSVFSATIIHLRYLSALWKTTISYLFSEIGLMRIHVFPQFYPCQCHSSIVNMSMHAYIYIYTQLLPLTTRRQHRTRMVLSYFSSAYSSYHMGFFFFIRTHSQLFFAPFSFSSLSLSFPLSFFFARNIWAGGEESTFASIRR